MRGAIAFTFTLNRYNYCWNKPTELQDLNGMWVTIAIGAVVGGLIGGGLEIYDQYKNGTLEWSWKYVGKIATVENIDGDLFSYNGFWWIASIDVVAIIERSNQ